MPMDKPNVHRVLLQYGYTEIKKSGLSKTLQRKRESIISLKTGKENRSHKMICYKKKNFLHP